ncbi:AP-3 complex subunit beta [Mycoemilia scoparia]|uniref:AP-3 complex subunit beta n=1 Tax=Mycoemilia scoparia TaxID=417184 RepID=A0A9W7ZV79_9FUNG|nr:AP-3 complex subunit beta [Mycoemilia scoparia]
MQRAFGESMSKYLKHAVGFAQDAVEKSLRLSEGIIENAKDLGLDTTGQFFDTAEVKLGQVSKELNGKTDKEKLMGLKRLIALIARGQDVSSFFPDVVKNVASTNYEIRKLVYIYLLRYAEQEQDLVLLSINTFQKDLSDKNQVIRAMALRVLSGIRVPIIESIVLLAIEKCSTDPSPYVRKIAAYAIPKLSRMSPGSNEELIGIVTKMLYEDSPMAIGAVIHAFDSICPHRYDLIHPHYRRWCRMVIDIDEWGQIVVTNLLVRYARTQFLDPTSVKSPADQPQAQDYSESEDDFYSDSSDDNNQTSAKKSQKIKPDPNNDDNTKLDPDHSLLLDSLVPLLQNRNNSVVMTAVSAIYHLAPPYQFTKLVKPLIRLMKSSRESAYVVLDNIIEISRQHPEIFESYIKDFFAVTASDPVYIRKKKLQVITHIVSQNNIDVLLPELEGYIRSSREDLVKGAIKILGQCFLTIPTHRQQSLPMFLKLLKNRDGGRDYILGEVVKTVSLVLMQSPPAQESGSSAASKQQPNNDYIANPQLIYATICYLSRFITDDSVNNDEARAKYYQLVCYYSDTVFKPHALDVLRLAAKTFKDQGRWTKLAIIDLDAQLMQQGLKKDTASPEAQKLLVQLHNFIFTLARYDTDYDIRDRARFFRSLLPLDGNVDDEEHSANRLSSILEHRSGLLPFIYPRSALCSTKPGDLFGSVLRKERLGSVSLSLNRHIPGHIHLPEWPKTKPKEKVDRGEVGGAGQALRRGFDPTRPQQQQFVDPYIGGSSGIYAHQRQTAAVSQFADPDADEEDEDDLDAFLNSEDERPRGTRIETSHISAYGDNIRVPQFQEYDNDSTSASSYSGSESRGSDEDDDSSEDQSEGSDEDEHSPTNDGAAGGRGIPEIPSFYKNYDPIGDEPQYGHTMADKFALVTHPSDSALYDHQRLDANRFLYPTTESGGSDNINANSASSTPILSSGTSKLAGNHHPHGNNSDHDQGDQANELLDSSSIWK